ncbi:T9SS type A sorting domain-containing protein [Bacteroidota bacterium]
MNKTIQLFVLFIFSLGVGIMSAQNFSIAGYATVNADGYNGTTGGQGGDTITVKTAAEFVDAINNKDTNPLIIYVEGPLSHSENISIKYISDISIIGRGDNTELDGFGLTLREANNIIIRNLKIHHVLASFGDAIGLENCHHVWIDHCELYSDMDHDKDYYDGLLDIKRGSKYITASWNIIHDHYKTSLIGNSDNISLMETDTLMKITYHHNYFHNTNSRNPSLRYGWIHAYNNYYKDIDSYCIAVRKGAHAIVENNYFENCGTPVTTTFGDAPDGFACLSNNVYADSTTESDDDISQTDCSWNLPYSYQLDSTDLLMDSIPFFAGIGIIDTKEIPIYTITVNIIGEGIVEPSSRNFETGTVVELEAVPSEGWIFDKWSGDINDTLEVIDVAVNSDLVITAEFIEDNVINIAQHRDRNYEYNIYPNPCNDFTNVSLSIKKQSNIDIELFDCTGKIVRKIVSDSYTPGNYIISINCEDMQSGIYICRVSSNSNSTYTKLIVK